MWCAWPTALALAERACVSGVLLCREPTGEAGEGAVGECEAVGLLGFEPDLWVRRKSPIVAEIWWGGSLKETVLAPKTGIFYLFSHWLVVRPQ